MSRILIVIIVLANIALTSQLYAQDYTVNFLKGAKQFEPNVLDFKSLSQLDQNEVFNNRFYRFVQFKEIPTSMQQTELANAGIKLLEYIPNKVYVASISTSIDFGRFEELNIRSITPIDYTYKIGERLENKEYPSWAVEGHSIIVSIQLYQDINPTVSKAALGQIGVTVLESMDHAQIVVAQVLRTEIENLIKSPFVRFVSVVSEPGEPESDAGRQLHRANAIDGDFSGARNYDGTGITFAINDDGHVGPHIDFQGRVNQQNVAGDFTGDHGDMTAGIAGGAGNLDPQIRGMATGSYMHIRQYLSSMAGTIPLHQDSAVLIFSSSYSNGCNGGYTNTTRLVDVELYTNPNLMQTFSAGNSNNQDCGYGAGNQWGNITGGHKIGKNVIATANLNDGDGIIGSSSRGPASDGRIKPDISAHGNSQMSTDPNNTYAPGGGTSAAAPGICGVMSQMYHAYRDLNAGVTAPAALMKAALLVTANDLGNDGPDFIFGWGKVNGFKAVKLLEENRYLNSTIAQFGSNTHSITIPAGVRRAKIMVYWADKEASTSASTALVNNLNCSVTAPSTTVHLPWILDHTPSATTLALPATRGIDNLNNMEEIAIDNPAAGTYTLNIAGVTVPFGSQEYYVVYEFLTEEITVIHPMGGEGLMPGTAEQIHWDTYGTTGTFNIEYTTNNGVSWNALNSSLPGSYRMTNWFVPAAVTGEARIRITRGIETDESEANFTIIERPQNIRVDRLCQSISAIQVAWDAVPGATSYDVFMLGQKYMDSVGTSSILSLNIPVANVNDPQWFSVRAVGPNGIRGLRQIAVYYAGSPGGEPLCYLDCFGDNDAGIKKLDVPGAVLEACAAFSITDVTMTVENLGLFPESNFLVSYQLGVNPVVTETYTDTLMAGGTASFTFATPFVIPMPAVYELKIWTSLAADSTSCNDTLSSMISVLDPVSSFPYAENFQGATFPSPLSYVINPDNGITWQSINTIGIIGLPTKAMYLNNFDYNASGQEDVFSFVTLDMSQAVAGSTANLTFDVAFRPYNALFLDRLRVDLSTDCSQSFNQVYAKSGFALATGSNVTTSWAPTLSGDWRRETVDLSSYIGGKVTLRFVNINGSGNNLYIDNINVDVTSALGLDPITNTFNLDVLPNPTNGETTINLKQELAENLEVEVVSMNGKVLFKSTLAAGKSSLTLDLSELPSAIYLLRMQTNTIVDIRKVILSK
jgi:hypothetical protein